MEVAEIIRKFGITLKDETHVSVVRSRVKGPNDMNLIVENKPAILAILLEEKREKERKILERKNKIAAIEGLEELKAVIRDWENYRYEFRKAMENGYGILPSAPDTEVKDVSAKYPRASAFLRAESYTFAANDEKVSAGKRALERIINGEDHETVLREMEEEWTKAAERHMWD